MKILKIYTDGAVSGNPGPGGYGAYVKWGNRDQPEATISGGVEKTTNNRMELMGVLAGLTVVLKRKLNEKADVVQIYSDSKYVVNSLGEYLRSWKAKGWRTAQNKEVQNVDLMREYDYLSSQFKCRIEFTWVKGHAGHTYNEKADALAVHGKMSPNKIEDTWYLENVLQPGGVDELPF